MWICKKIVPPSLHVVILLKNTNRQRNTDVVSLVFYCLRLVYHSVVVGSLFFFNIPWEKMHIHFRCACVYFLHKNIKKKKKKKEEAKKQTNNVHSFCPWHFRVNSSAHVHFSLAPPSFSSYLPWWPFLTGLRSGTNNK